MHKAVFTHTHNDDMTAYGNRAREHFHNQQNKFVRLRSMAGIRRTWDKSLYEQRARDRLEKGDGFIESSTGNRDNRANQALREEFKAAESNASGPIGSERAFLKSREARLNLEDKAGKIEIINPADIEGQKAGFWCEVCKVLLKDSASYLNHINGKKHQHALGYSMRVERANVDDVKDRLQKLKNRSTNRIAQSNITIDSTVTQEDNDAHSIKDLKRKSSEVNDITKRRKIEEEGSNHPEQRDKAEDNLEEEEEEVEDESANEMAQFLGFKGFGTSKK